MVNIWLFTKDGFFSAVTRDTIRDDELMIRGRFHEDLRRMLDAIGLNEKIFFTPEADYLCRTIIPRVKWAEYVAKAIQEIDYGNFKNAACADEDRYRAYHGVWLEMKLWESESSIARQLRSFGKGKHS